MLTAVMLVAISFHEQTPNTTAYGMATVVRAVDFDPRDRTTS